MKKRLRINFWIFGSLIIVLIIALGGYVGVQGSPSTIENAYVESMQRQDYESAFRTIDAQQFTLNGQHTIHAQFIQEAQAIDSREGKITSIREVNSSTDSENSTYTITCIFSRGQKSYLVHLLLKIINNTFLTSLFDTYPYRIVSVSRL